MSFQISLTPTRRAAGRFIGEVRDKLLKGLTDRNRKSGLTQSDIAKTIGVHRSVINRELRGRKDITLGRVAELATSMGFDLLFELVEPEFERGVNVVVNARGGFDVGNPETKTNSIGEWGDRSKRLVPKNLNQSENLVQALI